MNEEETKLLEVESEVESPRIGNYYTLKVYIRVFAHLYMCDSSLDLAAQLRNI